MMTPEVVQLFAEAMADGDVEIPVKTSEGEFMAPKRTLNRRVEIKEDDKELSATVEYTLKNIPSEGVVHRSAIVHLKTLQ